MLIFALSTSGALFAQTDDVSNNIFNVNPNPVISGTGLGAVLSSNVVSLATPVGLEHDGAGNLLATDINDDTFHTIDQTGAPVNAGINTSMSGAPIGISTNGTNIFITDTVDDDVDIYDPSGNYISSFSVAASSTFPEGITYSSPDGNLYVVDGDATGDQVMQYDITGTLLNTFPIAGSSQDGIALDLQRCVYWIYDSGTDTVRSYNNSFTQIDSFPGTGAAGFGNGEGVGVIGNSLFVMATGNTTLVEFDISAATPAANASSFCGFLAAPVPVPSNNIYTLILLGLMMLVGSLFTFYKVRD